MDGLTVGMALAAAGALVVASSLRQARRTAPGLAEFLGEFREPVADTYEATLRAPLPVRAARLVGRGLSATVGRYLPGAYLDTVARRLAQLNSSSLRAIDFLAIQVVLAGLAAAGGFAFVTSAQPSPAMAVAALVLLPVVGFTLPSARLARRVSARNEAIVDDLPDVLDLLAISVEAGLGFEGALDLVCRNFESPLADEFTVALSEMSLGRSRREALQNLKARTDAPDLSVFVLVLLQADALGMPVGRVLRSQAVEMRSRRRQRAREKAAKLPVKILLPLVLFIFPPILAVILGPAALSFGGLG